jgi:hypothetical protein
VYCGHSSAADRWVNTPDYESIANAQKLSNGVEVPAVIKLEPNHGAIAP